MTTELTDFIHAGISELQELCGSTAAAKGFHDDIPNRADFIAGERGDRAYKNAMNFFEGNLMMLIVSEATEAHDEIRTGHAPDKTYYPSADGPLRHSTGPFKPEGVPSEIADVVVRCFDYAYRRGFSLADIIIEKLAYNATRERLHGKKF